MKKKKLLAPYFILLMLFVMETVRSQSLKIIDVINKRKNNNDNYYEIGRNIIFTRLHTKYRKI